MVRVHTCDGRREEIIGGLVEEGHPEQFLQKYYPDGCSMEEIDGIFDKLVANAYGSRSLSVVITTTRPNGKAGEMEATR